MLVRTAVPLAPELCISVRQWPGRLGDRAHQPLDRRGTPVQVLVRDNNVDQALRVLKKKMQREGVFPMKPRVIPGAPGRGGPARTPRF
jgi:pentatricopeptide repeat protein